jgi:hypothetical protein
MAIRRLAHEHPRWSALIVSAGLALGAFAFLWFEPHLLFLDRRVHEAPPRAAQATSALGAASGPQAAPGGASDGDRSDQDATVTLASGGFRGLEHGTSGDARVLELADGSRFIRLDDLPTSNGPDLRVIPSDMPVSDDWHGWADGDHVDLGALKGNIGSSNYRIAGSVELDRYRTVVIWCRRFSVGFGVAPLSPA